MHSSKDLAVAPPALPSGLVLLRSLKQVSSLKRDWKDASLLSEFGVSVRTSRIAPDGNYPLPLPRSFLIFTRILWGQVFGLSSIHGFLQSCRRRLSYTRHDDDNTFMVLNQTQQGLPTPLHFSHFFSVIYIQLMFISAPTYNS